MNYIPLIVFIVAFAVTAYPLRALGAGDVAAIVAGTAVGFFCAWRWKRGRG